MPHVCASSGQQLPTGCLIRLLVLYKTLIHPLATLGVLFSWGAFLGAALNMNGSLNRNAQTVTIADVDSATLLT